MSRPVCLLHIGKTGGSYLKSIIARSAPETASPVRTLRHAATRASTAERFGPERRLAFVVRDPVARFRSAFYSRRRNGRPKSRVLWSPAEATAFLWFPEAEDLARALASPDPRLFSAAEFAMNAIQHLRRDYRHYLDSPEALQAEHAAGRIAACTDLDRLDDHLDPFMAAIGLPDYRQPDAPVRHANPPCPELSDTARRAIETYWAEEIALYHTARAIAHDLGMA